ncbi:MAG: universal stress protein [Chitinophagaceae bacterium]
MQKLFNKILLPIDFSSKSKVVLEKAIAIATEYKCSIHLLHVVSISPFEAVAMAEGHMAVPYKIMDNKEELRFHLEKLIEFIHVLGGNSIKVEQSILQGTWDEVIIDMVNEHQFDLVLIGQKGRISRKRKMLLKPDKIAAEANVPVITVPSNRRLTKLYSIVIPITDFLPVRKLMYGIYIASHYDTTIKLLGVENKKTKEQVQYYLNKAYLLIKAHSSVKVATETIVSYNVAEAVNQFAMLQSADLVIVNPGLQTKMPGLFSFLLGNILQKYSAPPVLTVNAV